MHHVGSSSQRHQCTNIQAYKGVDSLGHCEACCICIFRHFRRHRREPWVHPKYEDLITFALYLETLTRTNVWNIFYIWYCTGVESKIDKNAKIIVACAAGGTMRPTQNLPEGQQSRWHFISLQSLIPICFLFLVQQTTYKDWLLTLLPFPQITHSSLLACSQRLYQCVPLGRRTLLVVQRGTTDRIRWRRVKV